MCVVHTKSPVTIFFLNQQTSLTYLITFSTILFFFFCINETFRLSSVGWGNPIDNLSSCHRDRLRHEKPNKIFVLVKTSLEASKNGIFSRKKTVSPPDNRSLKIVISRMYIPLKFKTGSTFLPDLRNLLSLSTINAQMPFGNMAHIS
jgi:hypothetical protein